MNLFLRLIVCFAGALCLGQTVQGANLTTTIVEGSGTNWTAAIWKTNGVGTAVSPVAGNAYALVFNGVYAGNANNNTRVRNPTTATSTFPGDSLTINTNCEFREKSGVNGVVVNFPGVNGNPGLILNGGILNGGNSYALPVQVAGTIQVTHQSYISDGTDGAGGGFNTDTGTRQWDIAGVLGGTGNMVLINNKDSVPQIISGNSNTFSGQWIVQCGWLQGNGINSLGTNSIMVNPGYTGYTNDMPQATSPSPTSPDVTFSNLTGAIFEPDYDLNSAGTLTLVSGGQMNLHQNCAFTAVTIEGVSLSAGTHTYSELSSSFTNFLSGGSGSITVQSYGPPPPSAPGITGQPASVNLSPGSPASLAVMVSGTSPLFYQWQKGTNGAYVNSIDAGDASGSMANILSFSALTISDAADYRLTVTNAYGAATSQVATVIVTLPSGYNPQRTGFSYSYVTNYSDWRNSYVAGNGQMGIMIFGNPLNDTVIYNDRGFTMAANTNTPFRAFSQVSSSNLATIKSNCVAGNYSAADNLAQSAADAQAGGENNRHPGFKMLISIPQNGTVSNYSRVCNFRTGEISVNWSDNEGSWTRTSFVSRQDNVIVQYLPAPSNGTITCSIQLTNDPGMNFPSGMTFTPMVSANVNSNYLNMRVNYPPTAGSAGYEGVTRVVPTGGTVTVNGGVMTISNATSVILLTRTAKYLDNCTNQWNQQLLQNQLAAISTDYNTLLDGQIATHEAIYDRVKINLNGSATDRARANEDLLGMQTNSSTAVTALWERIFDAGRYYYISSSSSNTPPDLYGLWGGDVNDAGFFAYNMDANLNLQIGGGNIGDTPEAMAGYFAINEGWRADFETNALKMLGCRGMISAGNTPGTNGLKGVLSTFYVYQYATGEVPWLLYPFWEHYLTTGDTNFLQNQLYPLLKDMGYFYEDFLTLTNTDGNYILAGSVSPENQPSNLAVSLLNNSTFDISGAKFALTTLIQACNILGLEQGPGQGVARWTAILNKLPPYLINSDGALQEWSWPGLDDYYNHRHSSHLLTVWPYAEITPENTPALFSAAAIAMAKRDAYDYENAGHGWVHSALIAAGLKNAMAVNHKILYLLQNQFYFNSLASSHYNNHGSPFCTDTCNTMPDIMMEMLVDSSPGVLELLPALPQTLDQGAISGVKGRNRVTVQSLSWNTGANSVNCTLQSDIDQSITLIERSGINTISTSATVSASPLGQIARVIQLQAGVSTSISIGLGQINLALNRPVTVSSGANTATNAVDGNNGTAWSSASTQNEWIYVDLGSVFNLNGAKLNWGSTYGQSYNIQVSTDAVNWTNVFETPTGLGGVDRITFAANARYVRMLGVQSGTSGYSLSEFAVYGNTTALIPAAPANLVATTISSGQINLSWNAGAGATGYNVKQATVSGGPYTVVATNLTGLAYTNAGLASGTIYYFVVSATNSFGESANSVEASAQTVSTAVPQLGFAVNGGGQIQFSWPSDHTGWRLEAQANPPGAGLGTNWVTVSASTATNQVFIPINTTNGSVFFRLAYP
jgi:alpha-L-fucosidase 2